MAEKIEQPLKRVGLRMKVNLQITTDGGWIVLRVMDVIEPRASGNASELRCYAEANH